MKDNKYYYYNSDKASYSEQSSSPKKTEKTKETKTSAFRWKNTEASILDSMDKIEAILGNNPVESLMEQYIEKARESFDKAVEEPVQLKSVLILNTGYWYGTTVKLSFRVGRSRMYMVKDLTYFLEAFKASETVAYGKALIFKHREEALDAEGIETLRFLKRHFSQVRNRELSIYVNSTADVRKFFYLEGYLVDTYFEAFGENLMDFQLDDCLIPVTFFWKNPALHLVFELDEKGYSLRFKEDFLVIKGQEHLYFLVEGELYGCDPDYFRGVGEFIAAMEKSRMVMTMNKKAAQAFYRTVLKKIEAWIEVEVDAKLSSHRPVPMTAKVYLDVPEANTVIAKAFFDYGNTEREAFRHKDLYSSCDIEKEYQVEGLLKHYLPVQNKVENILQINGDEKALYDLVAEGLPHIGKHAEIYATDAFKKLKVHTPRQVNIGVRLNHNLLEVNFEMEGIDAEELKTILSAYRLAKHYVRLKDGSFVTLSHNVFGDFAEIADALDISDKELATGSVLVSQGKALYLDRLLRNRRLDYRQDTKVIDLLERYDHLSNEMPVLPSTLEPILRNYQKTGFHWLKTLGELGFGGILADDMGLGKTLEIITLLLAHYEADQAKGAHSLSLVVCPSSLVLNWESEFAHFAPVLKVLALTGNAYERKCQMKKAEEVDVIVISYDMLKRDIDIFRKYHFMYEIIDEAQYIKNYTTQNAKAVKVVDSTVRFALTGTPIENTLSELWSIFDYLMPGYLMKYSRFRKRYEQPITKEQNAKSLQALKRLIDPFILRRLKKDVLKELPDKTETNVYAGMEPEQKKLYLANLMTMQADLKGTGEKDTMQVLALLTRLRQICCDPALIYENYHGGSAKLALCLELLENAVESGHKVLLFSQFTSMLDRLKTELEARGIRYYTLTGATRQVTRLAYVNQFNEDDTPVFLISLKAGGTGLNLTGADMVIHYDPWWNLSAQNQATDRAHRIGQQQNVQVYNLITKGSVEEKIQEMQRQKAGLADTVIEGGGSPITGMSREEIMDLFSEKV